MAGICEEQHALGDTFVSYKEGSLEYQCDGGALHEIDPSWASSSVLSQCLFSESFGTWSLVSPKGRACYQKAPVGFRAQYLFGRFFM